MPDSSRPNIVLIGHRGSGKTTVARLLARKLNYAHLDTDHLIEQDQKRSIAEIFETDGEEYFRSLEGQALGGVVGRQPAVISVGGGAVERADHCTLIAGLGVVVWLTAPAEELHRRIQADRSSTHTRPPLTAGDALTEVRQTLARRTALYEALADIIIDTHALEPEAVAARVLASRP